MLNYIDIADKTTLNNVKTDTTNILSRGGFKYNATTSKAQIYDPVNSTWVDFEAGGGGGTSTITIFNKDSLYTNVLGDGK